MPRSMSGIMDEFKAHQLHSGSKTGPVVKNRKQAIAIGLSEDQRAMAVKHKKMSKMHGSAADAGDALASRRG